MSVIINEIKEAIKYYRRIPNFRKVVRATRQDEEILPVSVQVQTISACNAECVFCPYTYIHKTVPQGKMLWETYKKVVDEVVTFSELKLFTPVVQAEPLLDRDIGKCIAYFKEKINGKVPVHLSTNGYLLTDEIIETLVKAGVSYLVISLNAMKKDTYETLMPGFKFEKIQENIEKLLAHDLRSTKLLLRFLVTNVNDQEVAAAIKYWHKRGVQTEVITMLHNRAGSVEIDCLKSKRGVNRIRKLYNRLWFDLFTSCCVVPFRQMYILYNGDVLFCGNDWKREVILGNVHKNSLREIWNSPYAVELRKTILEKRYDLIAPCSGCALPDNYDSWR